MSGLTVRRLLVSICLFAVLLAALNPAAPGLFWALLAPVWLFFGLTQSAALLPLPEAPHLPRSPFRSLDLSRAPPRA